MRTEDRITALTVLKKRVDDELKTAKAEWVKDARPKQRDAGMIGDAMLGTVSLSKGRGQVKVTDKTALLAWAKAERPELLSYDPHISDDDVARLRREVESTGELPPGMDIVSGDPFPSVRLEPDAVSAVARAVADGQLGWADVLAVEQ